MSYSFFTLQFDNATWALSRTPSKLPDFHSCLYHSIQSLFQFVSTAPNICWTSGKMRNLQNILVSWCLENFLPEWTLKGSVICIVMFRMNDRTSNETPLNLRVSTQFLNFTWHQKKSPVKAIFKQLACLRFGRPLCFVRIEHGFFTMRDIGIVSSWATCYVYENIDLPYVFELWVTNMLREVLMRMFSSLTERMNVLREAN